MSAQVRDLPLGPQHRHCRRVMEVRLEEDDRLIARAEIRIHPLRHANRRFQCASLCGVYTTPELRSKGYAHRVVGRATQQIMEAEVDVALLFCAPELTRLYEQHGWRTIARTGTRIGHRDAWVSYDAVRMMQFSSSLSRSARRLFTEEPLLLSRLP